MRITLSIIAACAFATCAQAETKRGKPHGLDQPAPLRTFKAHGFNKQSVEPRAAGGLKKLAAVNLPEPPVPFRQTFSYASRVGRGWGDYRYRSTAAAKGKTIATYGSTAPVGKKSEAYLSRGPVGKNINAYGSSAREIQSGYRLQIQRR